MSYIFDEDYHNTVAREDYREARDIKWAEITGIKEIAKKNVSVEKKQQLRAELGEKLYPKLAVEGLSEKELNVPW